MSRRPRGLTPGERALWEAHARRYRPLGTVPSAPPAGAQGRAPEPPRPSPPVPTARPEPPMRAPEALFAPAPFRIGERAHAMGTAAAGRPSPGRPSLPSPVRDDGAGRGGANRKAERALARGRVAPQARIDLHGMTLERAHPALAGFVRRAHAEGLRLVLVITGKGRPDDGADPLDRPRGVLRRQVPIWLSDPPLAALVQRVAPAHRRHGGEGACYVHLRRPPRSGER